MGASVRLVGDYFLHEQRSDGKSYQYFTAGGYRMDADMIWRLFVLTGAPEFYLLYKQTVNVQKEKGQVPVPA